jgi:hypothetical protein
MIWKLDEPFKLVLGVIDRVLPGAAWLVQRRKVLEACSMKATFRTHDLEAR